jgi:ureidoacrylate peracid hydrolase
MPHPDLPQAFLDSAAERRGRPHVYERIEPARTALVVIDLQRAFLEQGAPSETPSVRDIVPTVNRLAAAARMSGGTVVWVKATFEREGWPLFFDHMVKPDLAAPMLAALQEGSALHELWPELAVETRDIVVPKYRFSAFLPGASALPAILRESDIDTVLIAGCLTNMCCDSSARDAVMTDFRTIMVSDANAARSDEAHLSALASFLTGFGDVRRADEVIALLAG